MNVAEESEKKLRQQEIVMAAASATELEQLRKESALLREEKRQENRVATLLNVRQLLGGADLATTQSWLETGAKLARKQE